MGNTINAKLLAVQTALRVPKNLYNSFGGYSYRNAETILEKVKPLLKKYGLTLTITDYVREIGQHVYIEATATLRDVESGEQIQASASAKEPESKKGMDAAQVSGATSSYARKYCLNGLFLLDDCQDPDTEEYAVQDKGMIIRFIQQMLKEKGYEYTGKPLETLTMRQLESYHDKLAKMPKKEEQK